jgi:hypothetical protein
LILLQVELLLVDTVAEMPSWLFISHRVSWIPSENQTQHFGLALSQSFTLFTLLTKELKRPEAHNESEKLDSYVEPLEQFLYL